ncbi:IPT/TIG domain-containing protein [Sphingobacterium arenae]|uniref:IPT/TIG domain-containing protein n=1 Tax=Sphingobacterium arenae TaxID=1280598 RepID=A0ABR7Y3G5_9SPHI|nr:IPT/TIG domain-containing protein [Sphingobacterium arenae]MBD1425803.1 IPT/TIG domain-containing protein [Sphingobacterium arenae]
MKNSKHSIGLILLSALLMLFSCEKDNPSGEAAPSLSVEQYFPNSGKAGTLVTIKGEGFSTSMAENIVEFSGVMAEVFSATSTELVVLAPESGSTGKITVKNGSQTTEVGDYTYQSLSVSRVSPANGPAGSNIRITGEGFGSLTQPAKVTINDSVALVVNISDTLIVAKVPSGAGTGAVKVLVDEMESTGAIFTYQEIKGIKPLTGGKGTKITLTGEGFETVKENNHVYFNDKQATVVEASSEKLVILAPEGIETNKVSVVINGQKTVSDAIFSVVPLPTISSVSPLSGPVGAEITIKGSTFSTIGDENKVLINGKEIPLEKDPTSSELVVRYPANIGSGKIEVVVNDQKVIGPEFVNQDLGIIKVSPESGLAGTEVTIEGTGFSQDLLKNKVSFNGVTAQIISATENSLKVVAPTNLSTGVLQVEVGGLSAEAPQAFRRAGVMTVVRDLTSLDFNYSKIVIDSHGNLYVSGSSTITKVTPEGSTSVFVSGLSGIVGMDILNDVIYIADWNSVKKVAADGTVTTIPTAPIGPRGLTVDSKGDLYYSSSWSGISKITVSTGTVQSMNTGSASDKCRIVVAPDGTIYHSFDDYQGIINRTLPGARGLNWLGQHEGYGYQDGPIASAKIAYGPTALKMTAEGNLIIMDSNNLALRQVDLKEQTVSTLVKVERGFEDGDLSSAKWGSINDITIDKEGNVYLLDVGQAAIRKVIFK